MSLVALVGFAVVTTAAGSSPTLLGPPLVTVHSQWGTTFHASEQRDALGRATPRANPAHSVNSFIRIDTVIQPVPKPWQDYFRRISPVRQPIELVARMPKGYNDQQFRWEVVDESNQRQTIPGALLRQEWTVFPSYLDRPTARTLDLPTQGFSARLLSQAGRSNLGLNEVNLWIHRRFENGVRIADYGEVWTPCRETYPRAKEASLGSDLVSKAYVEYSDQWWNEVQKPSRAVRGVAAEAQQDPELLRMMLASDLRTRNKKGFGVVSYPFLKLWEKPDRYLHSEGDQRLDPSSYMLVALDVTYRRKVGLYRFDRYGLKGFERTVLVPLFDASAQFYTRGVFKNVTARPTP